MIGLLKTRQIREHDAEMQGRVNFREIAKGVKVDRTETCFAGKTKLTMSRLRESDKAKHEKAIRGDVRLSNGMYRTPEEAEKYIRESLERELP